MNLKSLDNPVELVYGDKTYTWGRGKNFVLMSGPDIFEDYAMVHETATELKRITDELNIPWILKCSFDKANRQSSKSFRGVGMKEALKGLEKIKGELNCPLVTDVHEVAQIEATAAVADVLQIPAFLSRQTDLVQTAAKTGKVVNIKKGQFLAPWDMKTIAQKCVEVGNSKVLLCERGTSFGYNRLIVDIPGLYEMRKSGFPVVMDATHSAQLPGTAAGGTASGGNKDAIAILARAAVAAGVDGLFLETHPRPETALCDGPIAWPLAQMRDLLKGLKNIDNLT
ncbi:MAG: 3-deoxy-8-phosphooctulonate synthase [Bdellovibrionota bacterium]